MWLWNAPLSVTQNHKKDINTTKTLNYWTKSSSLHNNWGNVSRASLQLSSFNPLNFDSHFWTESWVFICFGNLLHLRFITFWKIVHLRGNMPSNNFSHLTLYFWNIDVQLSTEEDRFRILDSDCWSCGGQDWISGACLLDNVSALVLIILIIELCIT